MALLLLSALGAGCAKSDTCGDSETCDYDDNDCDRRVDEDFVDVNGVYFVPEHCGGCGISCADQFPTAAETACEVTDDAARCILVACPEDWHRAGEGACAPDAPAQCLTCTTDDDCTLRDPEARCIALEGQGHCFEPCADGCDPGFACTDGFCQPESGICDCVPDTFGAEFGCFVEGVPGDQCAGVMTCEMDGLSECAPALDEACNVQDDDCDGNIDEAFRDDAGRYIARMHCGSCGNPCVEPGPNMEANCLADGPGVRCDVQCQDGFVDVDGIAANGCECRRHVGPGPPPVIGGDTDCDGQVDSTDDFIYVATTGSDTNPGTLERPMRSVNAALQRANAQDKDVLVSRGTYDGEVNLIAGVDLFGGYRPDFRDRDLNLYPVVLENRSGDAGAPVLRCTDITSETRVEGFQLATSDASQPGDGSTVFYSNRCSSAVTIASTVVFAGRGADGIRGLSSSDVYTSLGGGSLTELNGIDGGDGALARDAATCRRVAAGGGGRLSCRISGSAITGGDGGDGDCPNTGCVDGRSCGNAGCTDFTVGGVCDFDAVLAAAVANPSATSGQGVTAGMAGDDTFNAPTNRGVCNFCDDNPSLPRLGQRGGDGGEGADGNGGEGCDSRTVLDTSSGILRAGAGLSGTPGADGSGGGGGSPGAGYNAIVSGCHDRAGGAGGGGGSGGCGAPAAAGGTGGGASVGISIRLRSGSGPTLENVRIVTNSGGRGGDGGQGASGGTPGSGGLGGGAEFWCARRGGRGGDGGRGGAGGGGGGGCGGGSYGVFLDGPPSMAYDTVLTDGTDIELIGVAGQGGEGGFSPGAAGANGLSGLRAAVGQAE